jgi:drug/metabolite transporter (DMT)-like permease
MSFFLLRPFLIKKGILTEGAAPGQERGREASDDTGSSTHTDTSNDAVVGGTESHSHALLSQDSLAALEGGGIGDAVETTSSIEKGRAFYLTFLLIGFADFEGNVINMQAFKYTSFTNIVMLGVLTTPVSMVLTRLVFKVKYTWLQIIGVAVCILGVAVLVTSDYLLGRVQDDHTVDESFYGDFLVVVASCFYAISNVGTEYMLKKMGGGANSRAVFLGHLGLFGTIVSVTQAAITAIVVVSTSTNNNPGSVIPSIPFTFINAVIVVSFALCFVFAYYIGSMFLEGEGDAALYDASFLTGNFWTMLAEWVLFQSPPNGWYFLSFLIVSLGLILYARQPSPTSGSFKEVEMSRGVYFKVTNPVEEESIGDNSEGDDGGELGVNAVHGGA